MKSIKKFLRRLKNHNFPRSANFPTEKLVFKPGIIAVRPTWGCILFDLGFLFTGIFALYFAAVEGGKAVWVGWLLGALFTGVGAFMLITDHRRRYAYIDLQKKRVYLANHRRSIALEKITGAAVLAESEYSLYRYELGVIAGDRFYTLYSAPGCGIFNDGVRLAKALDLPWQQEVPNSARKYNFNMIWGPLIFSCLIFYYVPGGIVQAWSSWYAGRNFVAVPAVIQKSSLSGSGEPGGSVGIDIVYSYKYKGENFESRRYSFFHRYETNVGAHTVRRIVKKYSAGQKTECFINPANPKESVLDRRIYHEPVLLDYIFSLIGIACLTAAINSAVQLAGNRKHRQFEKHNCKACE